MIPIFSNISASISWFSDRLGARLNIKYRWFVSMPVKRESPSNTKQDKTKYERWCIFRHQVIIFRQVNINETIITCEKYNSQPKGWKLCLKINLYLSDTRIYLNFKKIDECKCQILSLIYHYYHWFDNDFQSKYYLSYFLSCFYGRRNSTSTKSSSRGKWFLNP